MTAPLTELAKQLNQYVKGAVIIPLNAPTPASAITKQLQIWSPIA
ncbi:hypothetical protein [Lacticaseibacillus paracasei]|nr:hypothetical protein [Lacticaseibacillus paracasei]